MIRGELIEFQCFLGHAISRQRKSISFCRQRCLKVQPVRLSDYCRAERIRPATTAIRSKSWMCAVVGRQGVGNLPLRDLSTALPPLVQFTHIGNCEPLNDLSPGRARYPPRVPVEPFEQIANMRIRTEPPLRSLEIALARCWRRETRKLGEPAPVRVGYLLKQRVENLLSRGLGPDVGPLVPISDRTDADSRSGRELLNRHPQRILQRARRSPRPDTYRIHSPAPKDQPHWDRTATAWEVWRLRT